MLESELARGCDMLRDEIFSFPFDNRTSYANYLAQTYYFTKHSGRFMLALAKSSTNPELAEIFLEHGKEEAPHYLLAKQDLENLGYSIKQYPELESTQRLHDTVEHRMKADPYSLLGYVLCLETLAVKFGPFARDLSMSAFGEDTVSFLAEHSDLDLEHVEIIKSAIFKLEDKHVSSVVDLMMASFENFSAVLKELQGLNDAVLAG